jgi:hypothetical protein
MFHVDSFREMPGNNGHSDNNIANIGVDCSRAIDSRFNTFPDTERSAKSDNKNNESTESFINESISQNINIFRYKFADDFTCELFKFSKIHQYDHRKDFKEAWKTWLQENEEIVEEETRRLKNLDYQGNIEDKMFKSARYYFRKKSTEKKAPVKRRDYVGVNKLLLGAMDDHIRRGIQEEFKPSSGFDDFCNQNKDLLKEEVTTLCKNGFTDSNEIKNKIKKTYKNRYFLQINK